MKLEINTHIGWRDYTSGRKPVTAIYTGLFEPAFAGPEFAVLAYLRGLRREVKKRWPRAKLLRESLDWDGSNGTWHQGRAAVKVIDGEIQRLTGATQRYTTTFKLTNSDEQAWDAAMNPS